MLFGFLADPLLKVKGQRLLLIDNSHYSKDECWERELLDKIDQSDEQMRGS
jgi:hypothetical protein